MYRRAQQQRRLHLSGENRHLQIFIVRKDETFFVRQYIPLVPFIFFLSMALQQ